MDIRFEVLAHKDSTMEELDAFFGFCNVATLSIQEGVERNSEGEYKRFVVVAMLNRNAAFMRNRADEKNGYHVRYGANVWFIK